jgi:hypothetical protein
MLDFVLNIAALSAAIFIGSVAFDWWRKRQ